MNEKYPSGIGPAGRWLIFSGIPLAFWALFFALTEPHHALERAVGENVYPYLVVGVLSVLVIAGKILYERFPKRWVIPLGIVGWVLTASVFCWFFWFGPGALKF